MKMTVFPIHSRVSAGHVAYAFFLVLSGMLTRPGASAADDAKSAFEAGIDAFHDGDYPRALEAFETSYALRPVPKVLFNIAMCQKAMYRYTEALSTFRRFVERADLSEDDPLYLEVTAEQAELMTRVGHLDVRSAPPGATVRLDGKTLGRTPLRPIPPVDPGEHTVELEMDGFARHHQKVVITAGDTLQLQVTLQTEAGTVEIRCPPDGRLIIDERREEPCPFVGVLPTGPHRLTLRTPDSAPVDRAFAITTGERLLLDLSSTSSPLSQGTSRPGPAAAKKRRSQVMLALGAVSTTLGVGAGALGGFFMFRGKSAYDDGMDAIENGDKVTYDDINGHKLPAFRIGAAVSFVSCGVLLATGISLITLSRGRRESQSVELEVGFHTVGVRF